MPTGDYLEGAAVFALMLAGTSAAAALICRRRLPWLHGAPRLLALGVSTTLGILAVHMLPGTLGLLSRGAVLATTALLALATTLVPATRSPEAPGVRATPPPPAVGRGSWVAAVIGAAFTITFGLAMAIDQAVLAPGSVDVLNFHLPGVGAWMQSGSIWGVENFLADVAPGNYPNSGDVVLLAAVLPWSNDFLSHLSIYPFWALAGVAVYALATELRAPRPAAISAACLLLTIPVVAIPALVQSFPDAMLLASFGTGLLFLLRHYRSGATAELVLAALALGLAFGTKWYGVSSVAVVFAVWAVASLLGRRGLATVARQGALIVGLVTLGGGFWLLRNWVGSQNPFFPVELSLLGIEIFAAPRDLVREVYGFTIAGYIDDPGVWEGAILPQYRDALAAAGIILVAGTLIALASLGARLRGLAGRGPLVALAVLVALLGLAYSVTPYTAAGLDGDPVLVGANARYLIPALLVGAALAAWSTATVRWGALAFGLLALPALVDGARLASDGSNSGAVLEARQWLLGAAAMALLSVAGWSLVGARPWLAGAARGRIAVAIGALLAAIVFIGSEIQQRFNDSRYLGGDPTTDYLLTRAPDGNVVGLVRNWDNAGIAPPLPAFGPRYGNEVEYVGEYVDEMQRQYPDRAEFVAALAEGAYDYLLIGRGIPARPFVKEEGWAQSAGFERVVASERLALYRAR